MKQNKNDDDDDDEIPWKLNFMQLINNKIMRDIAYHIPCIGCILPIAFKHVFAPLTPILFRRFGLLFCKMIWLYEWSHYEW